MFLWWKVLRVRLLLTLFRVIWLTSRGDRNDVVAVNISTNPTVMPEKFGLKSTRLASGPVETALWATTAKAKNITGNSLTWPENASAMTNAPWTPELTTAAAFLTFVVDIIWRLISSSPTTENTCAETNFIRCGRPVSNPTISTLQLWIRWK